MLRQLAIRGLFHARPACQALQRLAACDSGQQQLSDQVPCGTPGAGARPPHAPSFSASALTFAALGIQHRGIATSSGALAGQAADDGEGEVEKVTLSEVPLEEAAVAIDQACRASEVAAVAAAASDCWLLSSWALQALSWVHASLDWPWYASIMAFNLGVKTVMLPMQVLVQRATSKTMMMQFDMMHARKLQEAMTRATDQRMYQRLHTEARAEMARVEEKHGGMIKNTLMAPGLMLVNSTVFISVFSGITALVRMGVPSLHSGGALWFENLTLPDPYLGLPVLCAAATLAQLSFNLGMGDAAGPGMNGNMSKYMLWGLKGSTLLFIPFGYYVSGAVALLWVSNTGFNIVQGFVLRNPWFRRVVGLPTMQELREMGAKVAAASGMATPGAAASSTAAPPASSAGVAVPAAGAAAALAAGPGTRANRPSMTLASGQKLYAMPPKTRKGSFSTLVGLFPGQRHM